MPAQKFRVRGAGFGRWCESRPAMRASHPGHDAL